MRVAVTGASGLIGTALVPHLRSVGHEVLRLVRPGAFEAEILGEADSIQQTSAEGVGSTLFWTRSLRIPILLAFLIAFFNQLSGINAVLYYTPWIFKMAGAGVESALLQSVIVGFTMLVFTMVAMVIIDHFGRRKLMIIGSIGYILGLSGAAYAFYAKVEGPLLLVSLLVFIAAHGFGQGAVI